MTYIPPDTTVGEIGPDNVWFYCETCDEEYAWPEGSDECFICGTKNMREI